MKNKIKHAIVKKRTVYLFTDNSQKDIKEFVSAYESKGNISPEIDLGYEIPELTTYTFLGKENPCISLWFDNEDVPDFYENFTNQ